MRPILIFIVGAWLSFGGYAQDQLGLRLDNYSGINGVLLNPAANTISPFLWDLNVVSTGLSAQTNYGFVQNAGVLKVLRNRGNFISVTDLEDVPTVTPNDLIVDYYDNLTEKYAAASFNLMGPSFMVSLESGHTFGLFTTLRAGIASQNIPGNLEYRHLDNTPYGTPIHVVPFDAAGIIWSELGFNYGMVFDVSEGLLALGTNIKFISPYEGGFFKLNQPVDVAQISGDTLLMYGLTIDYGLTNSNVEQTGFTRQLNGFGLGFDGGFSFIYPGGEDTYKWKFSGSILDLGRITFNRNTEVHDVFLMDTLFAFPYGEFTSGSIRERVDLFSQKSLGTPTASIIGRNFSIWMPVAISFQFDYQVVPGFFVNTTFIQRVPPGETILKRNNQLAFIPRYEARWLGAALPVVMTNYDQINLGASLRLAFLTIGSDDIRGLLGSKEFNGADFYFALKLNPFKWNLPWLGGGKGVNNKRVRCYEF